MRQLEFCFSLDHLVLTQPGQANPYHTKPRHFKPIYRPFLPIFGAKITKPIVKDFKEYSPLKYIYVGYVFRWSRFWTNSLDLETLLTTCALCPSIMQCNRNLLHSLNPIILFSKKYFKCMYLHPLHCLYISVGWTGKS